MNTKNSDIKINSLPVSAMERLARENAELHARLEEAEETLRAIREGEVDAVIVSGSKGDRVFSLVEADNLYRLMVETMNEAGLAVSPDCTVLFCNDRACGLLQGTKERLLGRSLMDFVAERDRERFNRLLQTTLTQPANEQFQFITQNDSPLPMHIWASRLDRPDGPMICLIGTDLSRLEAQKELIELLSRQREELRESRVAALNLMDDAIEAKNKTEKALKALRESEDRFRIIAETVPVLVCVTRLADSVVLFTNKYNNKAFGLRGEDIIGTKGPDYYYDPADRVKMIDIFQERGVVDNYTLKVKKADGTPFWIMTSVRSIIYNGQAAMIGASIDITDLKRAEEEIRKTEEQMKQYVEELRASNEELARFNHIAVDRELRMIELKKEINALREQTGRAPLYPLEFDKEQP